MEQKKNETKEKRMIAQQERKKERKVIEECINEYTDSYLPLDDGGVGGRGGAEVEEEEEERGEGVGMGSFFSSSPTLARTFGVGIGWNITNRG